MDSYADLRHLYRSLSQRPKLPPVYHRNPRPPGPGGLVGPPSIRDWTRLARETYNRVNDIKRVVQRYRQPADRGYIDEEMDLDPLIRRGLGGRPRWRGLDYRKIPRRYRPRFLYRRPYRLPPRYLPRMPGFS